MTPDELKSVVRLAYAESGKAPSVEVGIIWMAALGHHPADHVRRAVLDWTSTNPWPPRAADIADRLDGITKHDAAVALAAVRRHVAGGSGRDGSMSPELLGGDVIAYRAFRATREEWINEPTLVAAAAFKDAYQRLTTMARRKKAIEGGAGYMLPEIGRNLDNALAEVREVQSHD